MKNECREKLGTFRRFTLRFIVRRSLLKINKNYCVMMIALVKNLNKFTISARKLELIDETVKK